MAVTLPTIQKREIIASPKFVFARTDAAQHNPFEGDGEHREARQYQEVGEEADVDGIHDAIVGGIEIGIDEERSQPLQTEEQGEEYQRYALAERA